MHVAFHHTPPRAPGHCRRCDPSSDSLGKERNLVGPLPLVPGTVPLFHGVGPACPWYWFYPRNKTQGVEGPAKKSLASFSGGSLWTRWSWLRRELAEHATFDCSLPRLRSSYAPRQEGPFQVVIGLPPTILVCAVGVHEKYVSPFRKLHMGHRGHRRHYVVVGQTLEQPNVGTGRQIVPNRPLSHPASLGGGIGPLE